MPRLFFNRRRCGAEKEPAPPYSSRIKEKSTLHVDCRCPSGKEARPLRIFCIPCVFVSINDVHAAHPSPSCECQVKTAIKNTTPEASSTSPVHISATTDMTPVPTSQMPNRNIPVAQHVQESRNQGPDQASPNLRRFAPPANGNSDANRRSTVVPSSMLHDVNANMTVVLNLSEAGQSIYPSNTYVADGLVEHANSPREMDYPNMAGNSYSDQHPSSRSHSTFSRDVLDDDSDVTEETSYETLVKQLQQSKSCPHFEVPPSMFMHLNVESQVANSV